MQALYLVKALVSHGRRPETRALRGHHEQTYVFMKKKRSLFNKLLIVATFLIETSNLFLSHFGHHPGYEVHKKFSFGLCRVL